MVWIVKFDKKAKKQFNRLDKSTQKQIDKFIIKLEKSPNPRDLGQGLTGNHHLFWRYRVGDYRLMCTIHEKILNVIVVKVAHRREIYKK